MFNKKQINSIIKLSKFLINKYKIKPKFILGHSDISPERKKDPGEKFPWHFLSKKKISYWHNLSRKKLLDARNKKINKIDKDIFLKNLYKIGYPQHYLFKKKVNHSEQLTKAFQRRFRQELINGKIDKECLIISINIVKKFQ